MQDSPVKRYAHKTTHRKVLHLLRDNVKLPSLVLDAGGGEGALAGMVASLGHSVIVLDVEKERIRKASSPAVCADLEKTLPFPDRTFHIVLLIEVLEHLLNPFGTLCEVHRVLKPKGWFILTVPNVLNLASRLRFMFTGWSSLYSLERLNSDRVRRHLFMFPAPLLVRLLNEAGFEVVRLTTDKLRRSSMALLPLFLPLIARTRLAVLLGRTLIILARRL